MKRIAFILLLITMLLVPLGATKRALVIGVGSYPSQSGWDKIHGDKDISLVRDMLLQNGFRQQDVVELKNEAATAMAIRKALSTLTKVACPGDVIYIHFSGHGQRVTDVNGDEKDCYDESWVAYDAQSKYVKGLYEGSNHILDDELALNLSQIRAKIGANGKLVIVADACHSGGGSRGEDGEEKLVARGASSAFVIPGNHKPYTQTSTSVDWVFISACKSYQTNYEYKGNGSLTYILYSLREKLSFVSYVDIKEPITKFVQNNVYPYYIQTPVFEGPAWVSQLPLF